MFEDAGYLTKNFQTCPEDRPLIVQVIVLFRAQK